MVALDYSMDEVEDFHPIVKKALNEVLSDIDYGDQLEVIHHFPIPSSKLVVDFVIRTKKAKNIVLVIEVKKKKRDCFSERYWNQCRTYTKELSNEWEPKFNKYFVLTNIEYIMLFCDRNVNSVRHCLLKGNPKTNRKFTSNPENNADESIEYFKRAMSSILIEIMDPTKDPIWIKNWRLIFEELIARYKSIFNRIAITNIVMKRDVTMYEFLRILFYKFLKEFYHINNNAISNEFRPLPTSYNNVANFKDSLKNRFSRIIKINFKQIFEDHPLTSNRIIPNNLTKEIANEFIEFIIQLNKYMIKAVKEESTASYFLSLLKSYLYNNEEMHKEGKITTDYELATLLTELCINHDEINVLDIGTGIGTLSAAAYDQIRNLAIKRRCFKSHNDILSQLNGIEIDPFLNQLATFNLIFKSPSEVNKNTHINFEAGDTFNKVEPRQYDIVIMNPPFLRHDNKRVKLTKAKKEFMSKAIKKQMPDEYFIGQVSQPNLYFYFINWFYHYLKQGGKAGIIVMRKFLNNKDGESLKGFLLDKIETIVFYEDNFFEDFKVTTSIIILQKGCSKEYVNFLILKKLEAIDDISKIKGHLKSNNDVTKFLTMSNYDLKKVPRNKLKPQENWLVHFLDPKDKRKILEGLDIFVYLKDLFKEEAKRGRAGNNGGTYIIFVDSPRNPLSNEVSNIEPEFISYGLRLNKLGGEKRRHFILTKEEGLEERALNVPHQYIEKNSIGLKKEVQKRYPGMKRYFEKASNKKRKWIKIVNDLCNCTKEIPKLIVPRSDRTKHSVYCWVFDEPIVLSTNFFYFTNLKDYAGKTNITEEKRLKAICAYLISSFGQIQFEIKGNNHEGMRKIEGFIIEKFKCINVNNLQPKQIDSIVKAFEEFNEINEDVKGDEGINTLRRNLDMVIGQIIMENIGDKTPFTKVEDFVDWTEYFLEELVSMR